MAFGITPKHLHEEVFENLSPEQILVVGIEVAKKLGWKIGYTNENGFVAYTKFSWVSWSEEVSFKIDGKKLNIKSECTGSQLVDWGKNKENVESFLTKFKESSELLTVEEIAIRFQEIKNKTNSGDTSLNQAPKNSRDGIKGFFSLFIPSEGYFITPIIINLNILLFAIMVISGVNILEPDNESLIKWGANLRSVTLEGEWWRLLTSCFLHIGIVHLLLNVYALLYIGLLLEPHLGKSRFLAAYILSGIGGSVASLYWHDLTISAGASGAIFGLYGVFLAMLTTNLIEKSARRTLIVSIAFFVGYNLINGLQGNIDNAAHIGGLLLGIIIGYSYYSSLSQPEEQELKIKSIFILTFFILTASFFIYGSVPNNLKAFDEKMNEFAKFESMALKIYDPSTFTSDQEILIEIRTNGLHYWEECLRVINEANQLPVPAQLKERNKKLIDYCHLRIKNYELIYKAINENTERYQFVIEENNKRIETIINQLGGTQAE